MNRRSKKLGCVAVGVICSVSGLVLALCSYPLQRYILQTQVTLGPHSPSKAFWVDLPEPLITKVYLYNVSNPNEVALKGAKPALTEVGPFVYNEYHHKDKIHWNETNGTVTYQQARAYVHDAAESKKRLDDPVTILNLPAAMLSAMVTPMGRLERELIDMGIKILNEQLFATKTPRDVIFDGYSDPLLDAAETLSHLGISFPGEMDKCAIFYGRNNSDWFDGVFNIHTGRKNLSLANKMNTWNFTKHSFFPGKCGEVRGNAELFTPYINSEFVELYSNDLCRPIKLHFTGWESIKGVEGKLFEMLPSFLANRTLNPENACFDGGREAPSGVFNASACRFNAPVFISQPHFYQADPHFNQQFLNGGLAPSKANHSTYFVIEPVSGIPLEVVARFQVNLFIPPIREVGLFKHLKNPIYFPAFWFETKMVLPDAMKNKMWLLSNFAPMTVAGGALLSVVATIVVLVVLVSDWYCIYRALKTEDEGPALPEQDSPSESLVPEELPSPQVSAVHMD